MERVTKKMSKNHNRKLTPSVMSTISIKLEESSEPGQTASINPHQRGLKHNKTLINIEVQRSQWRFKN